jgi:hypothetical protein
MKKNGSLSYLVERVDEKLFGIVGGFAMTSFRGLRNGPLGRNGLKKRIDHFEAIRFDTYNRRTFKKKKKRKEEK